ncbi:hypothetical protein, conserved [Eimeria brunetti]|uniref:Uncharacterized protein n=1 Tax=Eimeria brunetti TaxID=51314 RepID=U6LQ06_9EIME|nr:hypothetical protein, conserved [Eimeria brunetti]
MDEVRLAASPPSGKSCELETLKDEQPVVHAADFAAGGGVRAADRPNPLQEDFSGKALSCSDGDVQNQGHGCISTKWGPEVQAVAADCKESYVGGITEGGALRVGELLYLLASHAAPAVRSAQDGTHRSTLCAQAESPGGDKFVAKHSSIFQRSMGGPVYEDGLEGLRKLGELPGTSRDAAERRGGPEQGPGAFSAVWQQGAPGNSGGDNVNLLGSLDHGGEPGYTKFPGERCKQHEGIAWPVSEDAAAAAGVLPSREDLVRRLLPELPQNCAALLMKSSIESLYDDSVAAVSSQAAINSADGDGEKHTRKGYECAGNAGPEKASEVCGNGAGTFTPIKCTARDSGNSDNQQGSHAFQACVESGEKTAKANCEAGLLSEEAFKVSSGQGRCVFEETGQNALGVEEKFLKAGCLEEEGNQSEGVVYVVREEWEAFTLYYCSHTGVVRAVASEVSRVTARNNPPDLRRGLPTMAVGGAGCQQCHKQQSQPCNGWWRSRYVLLRVTVTLADRSSVQTLQGSPASSCCGLGGGGSADIDSRGGWSNGRLERDESGTKPDRSTHSPFDLQQPPSFSQGVDMCTHAKDPSVRGDTEALRTQPRAPSSQQSSLRQPSHCAASAPLEQPGDPGTRSSSCERGGGGCVQIGSLNTLLSKHLGTPSSSTNDSAPFEATEFQTKTPGSVCGATEHAPPSVGVGKRTEEWEDEIGLNGGSRKAETTPSALLMECLMGNVSEKSPLPAAASSAVGMKASARPGIVGDSMREPGSDTWVVEDRRSRLASLLASPCDSFEGFVSSGSRDTLQPVVEKDSSSNSSPVDCFPAPPSGRTALGGLKPHRVPEGSSSPREASQQQLRTHGEPKFRGRGWQCAGAHRNKRRGLRRSFKSQMPPCIDSAGGARRALAQCYAACASTIGMDAVAEAQNSYLGLCVEERELAAVFLDFVALVAPGAIKASGGAERTRCGQRKAHVASSVGGVKRAVHDHTRCKRKQNHMGRAQGVKKAFCPPLRPKADGSESAARAAHLACRRLDDHGPQFVGDSFEFAV